MYVLNIRCACRADNIKVCSVDNIKVCVKTKKIRFGCFSDSDSERTIKS